MALVVDPCVTNREHRVTSHNRGIIRHHTGPDEEERPKRWRFGPQGPSAAPKKRPFMADKANPVLFIHGLWLHPTSWAAWQQHFTSAGYATYAPGWPGDLPTVDEAGANP